MFVCIYVNETDQVSGPIYAASSTEVAPWQSLALPLHQVNLNCDACNNAMHMLMRARGHRWNGKGVSSYRHEQLHLFSYQPNILVIDT